MKRLQKRKRLLVNSDTVRALSVRELRDPAAALLPFTDRPTNPPAECLAISVVC